jgi:small subunit ribosomal protein S11
MVKELGLVEKQHRGLIDSGLQITLIRDITTIPHNGCRPPKTSCLRYY